MEAQAKGRRSERYGWVVVFAAAVTMALGFGTLVSVSVFLKPLEAAFGWSRGETSFAYSSASFLAGFCGIFVGRLVDRMSTRPLVLVGAVMLGLSQVFLSRVGALWQLYLLYGVMAGALGNAAFLTPLMTNVGFWFDRHKGTAMGVAMAGQSLGAAFVPFVGRMLIAQLGWRQAYLVLGLGILALLVPLALLVREPPGLAAARAASVQSERAGSRGIIRPGALTATLCMAIIFCCICMSIPIVHLYPMALEAGVTPTSAAGVLSVMMVSSVVGRVGVGKVADVLGGLGSLFLASGVQTATIFWFTQAHGLEALFLIAVAFGVGYGGVIPSYAIIVREHIPLHRVGGSMGMVFFFGMVGMALGGYLGGVLYDWSGGYPVAYAAGAAAGLVNLTIVGTLWQHMRRAAALAPRPSPA